MFDKPKANNEQFTGYKIAQLIFAFALVSWGIWGIKNERFVFPSHHFGPPHIVDEGGLFFIVAAMFLGAFSIITHNVKHLAGANNISIFVWIGRITGMTAFILFAIGFFI